MTRKNELCERIKFWIKQNNGLLIGSRLEKYSEKTLSKILNIQIDTFLENRRTA
jgi:hypothetical protein